MCCEVTILLISSPHRPLLPTSPSPAFAVSIGRVSVAEAVGPFPGRDVPRVCLASARSTCPKFREGSTIFLTSDLSCFVSSERMSDTEWYQDVSRCTFLSLVHDTTPDDIVLAGDEWWGEGEPCSEIMMIYIKENIGEGKGHGGRATHTRKPSFSLTIP